MLIFSTRFLGLLYYYYYDFIVFVIINNSVSDVNSLVGSMLANAKFMFWLLIPLWVNRIPLQKMWVSMLRRTSTCTLIDTINEILTMD